MSHARRVARFSFPPPRMGKRIEQLGHRVIQECQAIIVAGNQGSRILGGKEQMVLFQFDKRINPADKPRGHAAEAGRVCRRRKIRFVDVEVIYEEVEGPWRAVMKPTEHVAVDLAGVPPVQIVWVHVILVKGLEKSSTYKKASETMSHCCAVVVIDFKAVP